MLGVTRGLSWSRVREARSGTCAPPGEDQLVAGSAAEEVGRARNLTASPTLPSEPMMPMTRSSATTTTPVSSMPCARFDGPCSQSNAHREATAVTTAPPTPPLNPASIGQHDPPPRPLAQIAPDLYRCWPVGLRSRLKGRQLQRFMCRTVPVVVLVALTIGALASPVSARKPVGLAKPIQLTMQSATDANGDTPFSSCPSAETRSGRPC